MVINNLIKEIDIRPMTKDVSILAIAGHSYLVFNPFPTRLLFLVQNQRGRGGTLCPLAKTLVPF